MKHGFILIDKPEGPTSHDCVSQIRRVLGERSIGHLGTLDPAASGLLVLAVGKKALKVVELFSDLTKEYDANVYLGAVSATYDREGPIEEAPLKPGVEIPDERVLRNVIEDRFIGKINQVPPGYSAVKIGGERAYRKMRQGRAVDMPTREVEIELCDVMAYDYPHLSLHVRCGSGTYIRSLAHDLGQLLHCGGYLQALRRTKVGEWSLDDAVHAEDAKWTHVLPLKDIMGSFPAVELTDDEAEDIRFGRTIEREVEPNTIAWHAGLPIAILMPASLVDAIAKPRKVL